MCKENKDRFEFFWGGAFSNFHFVKGGIKYRGKVFPTSEHAFMYAKAKRYGDEKVAKSLLKVQKPKEAKSLGRKVKNFDKEDWDSVSYDIMKEINLEKYRQSKYHRDLLLGTGDKHLVEASPYDAIWGIKMGVNDKGVEDPNNWRGKNWLGKVLMEVREELRKDS